MNESTTLIEVVKRGLLSSARLFLERGADLNQTSSDGKTPLSYAAKAGNLMMMDLLLEYNPILGKVDEEGNSPLDYTIKRGYSSLAKKLLTPNFYLTQYHLMDAAQHALYVATEHGNVELIEHLLDHPENFECDINHVDSTSGQTPLSSSASFGQPKACASLLERRARVDMKNKYGWTPLHCAAKQGDRRTLLTLIRFGAKLAEKTKEGNTPLLIAAAEGKMPSVRILVTKGHSACFRYLIRQQKYNVNSKNRFGLSPIDHVARIGTVEMVELLMQVGAQFEEVNKEGRRPLDYAIQALNIPVARHFLNLGCRISLRTWVLASKNEESNIFLIKHCLKLGSKLAKKRKHEKALEVFKIANCHLTKLCEAHFETKDKVHDLHATLNLEMSKSALLLGNLKLAEETSTNAICLQPYWGKVVENYELILRHKQLQFDRKWKPLMDELQ